MTEAHPLEERVAALETAIKEMLERTGSNCSKADLEAALVDIKTEFATQNASILAIALSLNKLQSAVQRWGAAGALVGSVALFVASKALGLG